jgi:hypothetical protein
VAVGGVEHLPAFVLVGRAEDDEVGNAGQEGQVEGAVVGGTVGADQAGPVDGHHHRQVLQGDVVDQLVVGPLQEG